MKFAAVVFDWDGTLMDSVSSIVTAMQLASSLQGLQVPSEHSVRSLIGLGMSEVLEALFPELSVAQTLAFRKRYRRCFNSESDRMQLYPGAAALLNRLQLGGIRMAVATGKGRRGLNEQLATTGFGPYFEVTLCAEESRSKPHPQMLQAILQKLALSPQQVLMVGDTEYDIKMAQTVGVASCALTHGAHDERQLKSLDPDWLFADLNALERLLIA